MLRVLIVDDEILIRKLLARVVNWQALGFEIVAEAADGEQALAQIAAFKPDLVMLDINLPILDGVSVLEHLNAQHIQTTAIMVTGYESFDYIQKAMRAGAADYVVKPLAAEEINAALNRVRQKIVKRQTFDKYAAARLAPSASRPQHSERALCVALCFEIDHWEKTLRNPEERNVWTHIVRAMCIDALSPYGDVDMDAEQARMGALLYVDLLPSDLRVFESIIESVVSSTGISLSIGIGGPGRADERERICREAALALNQKFLGGCGRLYLYSPDSHLYPSQKCDAQTSAPLMLCLRQLDREGVLAFIQRFSETAREKAYCRDYAHVLASEMVNCAIRFAAEKELDPQNALPNQDAFSSHILKCETLTDLRFFLEGLFMNLLDCAKELQRNKSVYIVERACEYIHLHYADDTLSQGALAAALFVHPNHLSKLFKTVMRMGVSDYLIAYRMEKAKAILEYESAPKITDIARRVGYTDPFYFSKSFKKTYGVSPSQYIGGFATQRDG